MSDETGRVEERLHAYHDGELGAFARWRFEWRLRRSPELRRELAALARVGELVRASEREAAGPDLWDRIEQRLPAVDARRAAGETEEEGEGILAAWWRPVGAVAAAAAVAVAVYVGFGEMGVSAAPGGTVRWVDSGGQSVLVLDDAEADVTIIWLLDETDDAVEGAAQGGTGEVV
ncbi:MAG: hypothetical protein QNK04_00180 [Myxococcota bacterium]|nr:hypothetical protein [Myxococcota bacterium]